MVGGSGVRRGAAVLLAALAAAGTAAAAPAAGGGRPTPTRSPIRHLVVIYDENVSFDHYFATYPHAANTDGTPFHADPDIPHAANTATAPRADTLESAGLLKRNPNQYAPRRLSPAEALTCDQNHDYAAEQLAYHGGAADRFVEQTEYGKCSGRLHGDPGLVLDYFDGNTVTALWNYARHYTLGDRSFGSAYGPSTPGALELISGQTHGVVSVDPASGSEDPVRTAAPDPYAVASPDARGVGTMINDPDPAFDDCSGNDRSSGSALAAMLGRNIGNLLNEARVSWGWFQGGFRPSTPWDGLPGHHARCGGTTHTNVGGIPVVDYSPHHNPFQYYRSTANPHHLPPASVAEIGYPGPANHNYDLADFHAAVAAGRLPAVSFLKAAQYQDGHAGYSDPIDEQHFLVDEINRIQLSPQWPHTAVVIAYDDSDGWYDHVWTPPTNGSRDTTPAAGGGPTDGPACQAGPPAALGFQDRCGPGPRQPLLVVSPYARVGHIDHTPTEQASITAFIEDNWRTGRIGGASFDGRAGTLVHAFDFDHPHRTRMLLNPDGSVRSVTPIPPTPADDPSPVLPATLATALAATALAAGRTLTRHHPRP
ncbi:phospholipase C [Streptomyces sp. NPDC092296]|uniref:phospholipase C n=1 Tax=Streptomyces sp. NPDC092296 TaxID=3366012 RepID=UPI00382183CC